MMKRVLFIFDRVTHYNSELFKCLEPRLRKLDIELVLLAGYSKTEERGRVRLSDKVVEKEARYLYREFRVKNFIFRHQKGVLSQIKQIKPDIVVMASHVGNLSSWNIMRLKKKMGFSLVAWQCGYEFNPSRLKDFLLGRFIKGFDYHLAYHTNAKKYALRYGARKSQVTVMHNTINNNKIERIDKSDARNKICAAFPQIGDRQIVLFVGAILKEKKLETLCDAMLRPEHENAILLVVGDGPHLSVLRSIYGDTDNIIFTGSVIDGVGTYFDASDVFLLPGTGGLAINEAMAHALPVISGYADGSADDLVIDGKNGYRLQNADPQEISESIAKVLMDPVHAREMGLESLRMLNEKFSFNLYIDRIVDVLEDLC